MGVGTTFLKIQKVVIKNAPTILAVAGGVAAVASAALAVNGTLKAQDELDRIARERKGEDYYNAQKAHYMLEDNVSCIDICERLGVKDIESEEAAQEYVMKLVDMTPLTVKEKIFFYAKHYGPAAVALIVALICIFSGNHISKKRILQLGGALALSRKSLEDYKNKVEEMLGKKKAEEINDEVVQDRILKNPPTNANTVVPTMGNLPNLSLWYDVASDRYFYSNHDIIRRAELEAQRQLEKAGSLTRNDVYAILGIREIDLAEDRSWVYDRVGNGVHQQVILKTGAMPDDNGNPIGTLEMNDITLPDGEWFSEV